MSNATLVNGSNTEDHLVFPSGRPVASARKDAKKLKSATVPYCQALDVIARQNGLDMSWAQAMEHMQRQSIDTAKPPKEPVPVPATVFSYSSLALRNITQTALKLSKETGSLYETQLRKLCDEFGFVSPYLAYRALHVPVKSTEIHRLLIDDLIIVLNVAANGELFLLGKKLPSTPKKNDTQTPIGFVAFGPMLKLSNEATRAFSDVVMPGWWICKYSTSQPRIPLAMESSNAQGRDVIHFIADFLGIMICEVSPYHYEWRDRGLEDLPVMASIRLWAEKNPRVAKSAKGQYWGFWGQMALRDSEVS